MMACCWTTFAFIVLRKSVKHSFAFVLAGNTMSALCSAESMQQTHVNCVQASKAERQQLLAAIHPHACDGANSLAEEALMAVKGVLECSNTEARQLAEDSGTSAALQSLKQGLKSHLNSICHVETYVVEDVQCKRDLLQLCSDIDSMPCLTSSETSQTKHASSKHQEL